MAAGAVQCSSCRMWNVRDTTSDLADFTCRKCTQLQLVLTDRVRDLELDELRISRVAEGVTDSSHRHFVTPKNEGRWVTVRGKGRGKKLSVQGSPVVVRLSNIYIPFSIQLGGTYQG